MKYLFATVLLFGAAGASAQNLKCAVKYKDVTKPMYWFAANDSHHSDGSLDPLSVMVKEKKSSPDKIELTIMDAVDDATWEKFDEITAKADLSPEQRTAIRQLGRTRVTQVYLGLYNGLLHFEHRFGKDANIYEISCVKK